MSVTRRAGWFLAIALGGCHADAPLVGVPVTTDQAAWSGGTLVLRSPAFTGTGAPVVTIGSDTLGLLRYPSDSVRVQLPDTDGLVDVSVQLGGDQPHVVATVQVYGLHSFYDGPRVAGPVYRWPGNGNPTALAVLSGRLVTIDFRLRTAHAILPDTGLDRSGCLSGGPMPSVDPSLVVVTRGSCGAAFAVRLADGAVVDTGPTVFQYPVVHLGRGRWAVNLRHYFRLYTGSVTSGFAQSLNISGEYPSGFVVSPRRDRVVPIATFASNGVPVFDTVSAGPIYTLPSLTGGGAAFTEGGDTLFHAGDAQLFMVNAATGAILARAPLHVDAYGSGVALDPFGARVFVAGTFSGKPVVEVFDRSSLKPITALRPPASANVDDYYGDHVVLFSSAAPQLYVVINTWYYTTVLRYDIPTTP